MPLTTKESVRLYYEESGAGSPVLFVAGLQGGVHSWRLQVSDLASSFHCISFDNRGVGRSDKPDEPYSIAKLADDAVGLLDHLGIEEAHIVGSSMGGMVAQHMAVHHPKRVLTLSLHCTSPASDHYIRRISELYGELSRRYEVIDQPWVDLFCFSHDTYVRRYEEIRAFQGDGNAYPMPAYAFRRQLAALAEHDLTTRLPEINKPTLIGCGSEDAWMPLSAARLMSELIKSSRLEIFDGMGHLYKWEDPARFNEVQRRFLFDHGSPDRASSPVPEPSATKE